MKHLMNTFPDCGKVAIGVSEITSEVFPEFGKSTLRDFVPDGLLGGSGSSFAKRLGCWLRKTSTKRWGDLELIAVEDTHGGTWKYQIGEKIKKKPSLEGAFDETEEAAA